MKKIIFTLTLILSVIAFGFSKTTPENPVNKKQQTISFTENKGQVYDQNYKARPDVLYGTMTGNMAVHIKKTGVSYQLYRIDSYKQVTDERTKQKRKEIDQPTPSTSSGLSIYRIDLNWLNCNKNFTKTEDQVLNGYNNYYLESCPDGALNVKSYKGVTLHNLYEGINLHYYEKNNELKHDYSVAAHADYKQIQVKVEGAEISVNEDGSLLLSTPLGKVQEGAPLVFQNGKRLKAKWIVTNNVLSFEIENYNSNYELIIDPITRIWGTYYGGASTDEAYSCSVDAVGNVYEAGSTLSSTGTIIATSGSHQSTADGSGDGFLVKFNANGVRQWATYYGGSQGEIAYSSATDLIGNIYASGITSSSSGISTANGHQPNYSSNWEGFLVKFNSSGVRQWATYYGGAGDDYVYSCSTNSTNDIYIAGRTTTSTNTTIATFGSHQSTYGGGSSDAFLAKFNSSGIRQWGTYYGGSLGNDFAQSCAVDLNDNIFMAGTVTGTAAANVVSTSGSYQTSHAGGGGDAFLVKFNGSGVRQWGTYYGDNSDEGARTCATDNLGNVFLAGPTSQTVASLALYTLGAHQTAPGGNLDGMIAKFNSNGVRQWGTYYGGAGLEQIYSSATDALGNVYFAGTTGSNSGSTIATSNGHQFVYGGGSMDGFLVKFNTNGIRQSATYYGGTASDDARGCAVDVSGNVYIAGITQSTTGLSIATIGSHQSTLGAFTDGFLVKFDGCEIAPSAPSAITGSTSICAGITTTYNTIQTFGAASYTWSLPSGWSGSSSSTSISATPGSSGVFTLTSGNACGVSPQRTLNVTVNALPTLSISSTSNLLCVGESATLSANGAVNYTFNPGGSAGIITVSPVVNTTYSLSGIDANGCKNTAVITQSVSECAGMKNIENLSNSSIRLYPNPTSGTININLDFYAKLIICNNLGQVIHTAEFGVGIHQLDLSSLTKGIYFLRDSKGITSCKFVIY
ncbi:hypothetical protein CNR22_18340 [Sphingobacteriaceae bacterium]|nr:hypothetical protein CNR22_18340 [Sphingobacteriaceae bacterium]